jgi:hypothetical protein
MAADRQGWPLVGRGLTKTVYCDVDGTLLLRPDGTPGTPHYVRNEHGAITGGYVVNRALVNALKIWLGSDPQNFLVIWSMGGEPHAEFAMHACTLDFGYNVGTAPKPDLILDDARHEKLFARIRAVFPAEFVHIVKTQCPLEQQERRCVECAPGRQPCDFPCAELVDDV